MKSKLTVFFICVIICAFSFLQGQSFDKIINGQLGIGHLGTKVATGDVNNDGYDDIIASLMYYPSPTNNKRAVRIFFGGKDMDTEPDVLFVGKVKNGYFGDAVSAGGDVNNDGYDDILIKDADRNVFLYYGGATIDTVADKVFQDEYDVFGRATKIVNDINGDGFDDIIISGSLYFKIYYGGTDMDTTPDMVCRIDDFQYSKASYKVNGLAYNETTDINNDGHPDILISFADYDNTSVEWPGYVYVYYAGPGMDDQYDLKIKGPNNERYFGGAMTGIGDINDDGKTDFAIGNFNEWHHEHNSNVFIYTGGKSSYDTPDIEMLSDSKTTDFGCSLSLLYDINNDGVNELLVGEKSRPNSHMVAHGKAKVFSLDNLDINSPIITYENGDKGDEFGRHILTSGDFDGNGMKDILFAAWRADTDHSLEPGKLFIDLMNSAPKLSGSFMINIDEDNAGVLSYTIKDDQTTVPKITIASEDENLIVQTTQLTKDKLSLYVKGKPNYHNTTKFTITVDDKAGDINSKVVYTVNVFIRSINDKPVLTLNKFEVNEGGILNITNELMSITDEDTPDDSVYLDLRNIPASGTLYNGGIALSGYQKITVKDIKDGMFRYIHNGSETAKDEFSFKLGDFVDLSEAIFIDIKVIPVNDKPVWSNLASIEFEEDRKLEWPVANWFTKVEDIDNADTSLVFSISGENISAIFNEGKLIFETEKNWFGEETVKAIVSDGQLTDTTDLLVKVTPVNDAPEFENVPDKIKVSTNSIYSLLVWELVNDAEDSDTNLTYSFEVSTDSVTTSYKNETGILSIKSDKKQYSSDTLIITVTDTEELSSKIKIILEVGDLTSIGNVLEIPQSFALHQNYPNPFNPTTQISYDIPESSDVKIKVLDMLGREIKTLVNQEKEAGKYTVNFNAENLSSGMYLVTMKSKDYYKVMKILLVK